jgi:hypothetical protein
VERRIWRISIRPKHEDNPVTLSMLHVDCARTRMPLVCTFISMLVLAVFVALCSTSQLIKPNASGSELQNAKPVAAPQATASATNVSLVDSDPYGMDPWVMHGREF